MSSPLYHTLGFEPAEVGTDGLVAVHATGCDRLMNRDGRIHGGAIAAIVDAAATQAAASSGALGPGAATADLSVSYLEPASGRSLAAVASVVAVHARRVEVRAEVRCGDAVVAVGRVMIARGRT